MSCEHMKRVWNSVDEELQESSGHPLHMGLWFHQGRTRGGVSKEKYARCCEFGPQRKPKMPLLRAQRAREHVVVCLSKGKGWLWWSWSEIVVKAGGVIGKDIGKWAILSPGGQGVDR